jgi:membrane protease YdiL (CAAX protease family)
MKGGTISHLSSHSIFDHFFFAILLIVPVIEWKWSWPRYLARLAADPQNARRGHYRRLLIGEWIPTIALLTVWLVLRRPWSALRFSAETPPRLVFGLVCVIALIVLLVVQRRALLRSPDRRARVRKALVFGELLLPHSESERHLFWTVSVTAGICEEIFFRGFLTWYFLAWMGPVLAVILASVLFGIGHVYLGVAQVPKTATIGLVFAIVVSLTGSLWPAILLHAAIDWNSGELGFRLLRTTDNEAGG